MHWTRQGANVRAAIVSDQSYLNWPFFEERHRNLAGELEGWAKGNLPAHPIERGDVDQACRDLVAAMGEAGWLNYAVPDDGHGFDLRTICLIREILGRHGALADFAFAMQGLGTASITLFGTKDQRSKWLPGPRKGQVLTGFALSEPQAGSDISAMTTLVREVAAGFEISGTKTWISNGGIAGQYVVFAKDGPKSTAFVVSTDTPGLTISDRLEMGSPHPMATLKFDRCVVAPEAVIGDRGAGIRIALSTLDIFRPSVGAAALGLARRAFDEAKERATTREIFGGKLADLQLVQAQLADMALKIDAAALLVYRAAWAKDSSGAERITREAAMAKLFATDAAQEIIDSAVQIWGAAGVQSGSVVEHLYRDIRAMRIYEGASEVQKMVIARTVLAQ